MAPDGVTGWAGAMTAAGGPGVLVWALLLVLAVVSGVGGWVGAAALQRSWREADHGDGRGPGSMVELWGEPDLAEPSRSREARAEVAELEALWQR